MNNLKFIAQDNRNLTMLYWVNQILPLYKEYDLLSADQKASDWFQVQNNFLDSILLEIDSYFPEGAYKDLPRIYTEAITYGHKEIQNLANRFDLEEETVSKEWTNLLTSMIDEDRYCEQVKFTAESFWPLYLRKHTSLGKIV